MAASPTQAQRKNLGWVLLEVLAALAIAVAIVWWTFPKKPKSEAHARHDRPDGDAN
jgi:flagellar basal body-associated protein FliL